MQGQARLIDRISVRATAIGLVGLTARQTPRTGIRRFVNVTPVEPQTVMWVVPGDVIQYTIESNTQWKII